MSFLQAMCVLGYCVAPLDAAAFVACFVSKIWIRVPVVLGAWAWCVWGESSLFVFVRSESTDLMRPCGCFAASVNFLDGTKIEPTRILLAVYPILFVLVIPFPRRTYQFPCAQVILLCSRMDDPHFLKKNLFMWSECTVCTNKARHEYLILCVDILLSTLLASITRTQ